MQYSSFISDHIPCRYKSLIEESSLKQLSFASDDRAKVKPEFFAEFRNKATPIKGKSKTCVQGDMKGSSTKRRQGDEGSTRSMSLQEIFKILKRGGKFTRMFRGWKICSLVHDKPILYGLPDDPKARLDRSNSLYLTSYDGNPQLISRSAKLTNLHSPSSVISAASLDRFGQMSAMKVRSCHVAGTENLATSRTSFLIRGPMRPASSGTVSDRQKDIVRSTSTSKQHSATDDAINVNFMHTQDSNYYAANYREGYTYRKLHEQRPCSSSTPAVATMPAATTVTKATRCSSSPVPHPLAKVSLGRIEAFPIGKTHKSTGTPTSSRSTPTTTKVSPKTTKATPTPPRSTPTNTSITKLREKCNQCSHPDFNKDQENERKIPTRWPANQRFHDLCDPQWTVKNTSPTEVAVLHRVTPTIQTLSSPSIPSNTNGKFGGKSKDWPYPFELHISAASCPVRSTAKKAARFNI